MCHTLSFLCATSESKNDPVVSLLHGLMLTLPPLPSGCHYSAEDQSGRQGQDPAAGGAARRRRVHLPLQRARRRAGAARGPRQGQGAAADAAAQVQTQGQQGAGGKGKVSGRDWLIRMVL